MNIEMRVIRSYLSKEKSPRPDQNSSIEDRLIWWLLSSGDTGSSSKSIAAHMIGQSGDWHFSYPSDGGDLGRCLRLLDLIPEWKPRMTEMGRDSDQWSALLRRWDDLSSMHEEGREVYPLMRSILERSRKKE